MVATTAGRLLAVMTGLLIPLVGCSSDDDTEASSTTEQTSTTGQTSTPATPLDGTVKWFNAEKGYGFVQADDGGKDVFVHISVVEGAGLKSLAEGALVSMRVTETRKGREAVSVALRA